MYHPEPQRYSQINGVFIKHLERYINQVKYHRWLAIVVATEKRSRSSESMAKFSNRDIIPPAYPIMEGV